MMPRLDGIETIQRLRADTSLPFIPVVMLTAQSEFSYAKVRKMPRPDAAAQGCLRSFRMRSGGKYR